MKLFYSLCLLVGICLSTEAQNKIQVLSAVIKDKKIENAQVILQKNGEKSIVGYTNSEGIVVLNTPFQDDGNSMVIIKKEGYSTLVAKCPCQGLTYAISPVMDNLDGIRIVLSWGKNPRDLDSHLWYGNQHIFFQKKEGVKANLDVDDTDSYGPETITIDERDFNKEYYYAVHDFTDRESPYTSNLSNSSAKVFVYIGESLVKTYYIPTNKKGNLWTVFKITKGGDIEDINSFTGANGTDSSNLKPSSINALGSIVDVNKQEALRLNALGTTEYKKQNYVKAIEYYMAAIDIYPEFGQAYGNLGLSYKKNGQDAEALWANRKAIALASGATESVTKAGAHYNIGRIYEERGEYQKAKDEYEASKSYSNKKTYDEAINRMDTLLK